MIFMKNSFSKLEGRVHIYLTRARQLADSLLHCQVSRRVVLRDFDATVRACGDLIAQSSVSQQVCEAPSAHQMTHDALQIKEMKRRRERFFVSLML